MTLKQVRDWHRKWARVCGRSDTFGNEGAEHEQMANEIDIHIANFKSLSKNFEQECSDVDVILEKLGLSPENVRTEGGYLIVSRVCSKIQETLDALVGMHNFSSVLSDKYSTQSNKTLTVKHLADAFACFSNAAISAMHSGTHDVCAIAHGMDAVACRLSEPQQPNTHLDCQNCKNGKAQWDELASILGVLGDDVDAVMNSAKELITMSHGKAVAWSLAWPHDIKKGTVNTMTTFGRYEDAKNFASNCGTPKPAIVPLFSKPTAPKNNKRVLYPDE